MIFLTVGTQLPFDRLVGVVDAWAARQQRKDIFAQISHNGRKPKHIKWVEYLTPEEFIAQINSADVIISHAGAGTIFIALQSGKPIIVLPRLEQLHEQRNDHQVDMAQSLSELGLIEFALDERCLLDKLNEIDRLPSPKKIGPYASKELINTISAFING